MASKAFEKKVHEKLHENIYLLTLAYPPPTEFNSMFKINMFVKNNKVASQQVIYYLLYILDPHIIKQKISVWPILDIKSESQFRSDVMKYVNELNNIYPDADIPPIMTSHLISPGGYRFARFILVLSQFVLYEHLKSTMDSADLILPIKCSANKLMTAINIKNLKIMSNKLHQENIKSKQNFEKEFKKYKIEADNIVQTLNELNITRPQLEETLKELQMIDYKIDFDNYNECLKNHDLSVNKLMQIKSKVKNTSRLIMSKQGCLDYNPNDTTLNLNGAINLKTNLLNLIKLLECFETYLKRKFYEIKPVNSKETKFYNDIFSDVELQYHAVGDKLESVREQYQSLMTSMNEQDKNSPSKSNQEIAIIISDSTDSIIALPLEDSETNI